MMTAWDEDDECRVFRRLHNPEGKKKREAIQDAGRELLRFNGSKQVHSPYELLPSSILTTSDRRWASSYADRSSKARLW